MLRERISWLVFVHSFHSWWYKSVLLLLTKRKREESQSWSVFKCGTATVQILREQVRGQLQFAQALCGWYGGRERGDWTRQLDLTNTERGQCRPTSDAARSCLGDWEKMLSDLERASSIMAPLCLSAGWLWEKRGGIRERRGEKLQESTSKANEREQEKRKMRRVWPQRLRWLTGDPLLSLHPLPSVFFCQEHSPLPFFFITSLNCLTCPPSFSFRWSLCPSIPPSWTAGCGADRPWSERGSCQHPAAEPSLTGH